MARELTHLHLVAGPAGWVQASWRRRDEPERTAWFRFVWNRRAKRWTLRHPRAELRLLEPTLASVSDLPFERIELAVNASAVVRDSLEEWINDPQPVDLAAAFKGRYKDVPRLKLQRPHRRRLDDHFFREVAAVYRDAVIRGLPPGKTIAADTGAPAGTVNRWIATAREKGFLPPGQSGKVTV